MVARSHLAALATLMFLGQPVPPPTTPRRYQLEALHIEVARPVYVLQPVVLTFPLVEERNEDREDPAEAGEAQEGSSKAATYLLSPLEIALDFGREERAEFGGLRGWRPMAAPPYNDCRDPNAPRIAAFTIGTHRFTPRWIARALHGVIADHCRSKTYQDLYELDGGTVGISHFAHGSLRTLYREMDTHKYFGRPASSIPDRPHRHSWWRAGMRRFLNSPESRVVQQRAWKAYITPVLTAALEHGWETDRELAVAAGVGNSLGPVGFRRIAKQNAWNPERTLSSYARMTTHKERRRIRLEREFPLDEAGFVKMKIQEAPAPTKGARIALK